MRHHTPHIAPPPSSQRPPERPARPVTPPSLSQATLLQLQRQVGNRATQQLVQRAAPGSLIQCKKTNTQKIELLHFKETRLMQEQARVTRLQELVMDAAFTKAMPYTLCRTLILQLAPIGQQIHAALQVIRAELQARGDEEHTRNKDALNQIRTNDTQHYGGIDKHKIANVPITLISDGLDAIEDQVVTTPQAAIIEYNRIAPATLPQATLQAGGTITVGPYIHIKPCSTHYNVTSPEELHLLRLVRQIIQTPRGSQLVAALTQAQQQVAIRWATGTHPKDQWSQTSSDAKRLPKSGTKTGKPTLNNPRIKGDGTPSPSIVTANLEQQLTIDSHKTGSPSYALPFEAHLFHELTHALHAAQGKQDNTKLKQRSAILGTYTPGAWVNQEEKNTVAEETKFLEQIGFPMKRLMYGQLAGRIDK